MKIIVLLQKIEVSFDDLKISRQLRELPARSHDRASGNFRVFSETGSASSFCCVQRDPKRQKAVRGEDKALL